MAWIRNKQSEVAWGDNTKGGVLGGFGRAASDADQTFIGPIYSPDGTARYIVVDDTGAVSSTTTKP